MADYHKVVALRRDFWELDDGVIDQLAKISANSNIQSLYSKRHDFTKSSIDQVSYIEFCYTKEVELQIFRNVLVYFVLYYNKGYGKKFHYLFDPPKDNPNWRERDEPMGIGCLDDNDHFRVNSIKLHMNSGMPDDHQKFWDDLVTYLSDLK